MRIALVTDGVCPYVIGGIQRHSFNLVSHLARLGVEIDLYHTDRGSAEEIDKLEGMSSEEKSRIASIAIPWPKLGSAPGHYLRELSAYSNAAYHRFVGRPSVDFVYTQGFTGSVFLQERACGRIHAPVAINLHGLNMFQAAPTWRAVIQQALFRRVARKELHQADYVFCFGGRIRSMMDREGVPPERVLEVPNAVPKCWIREKPSQKLAEKRRFIFIGRYERLKGIEELNKALAMCEQERPFSFDFVGPMPPAKQLRHPCVNYHGAISGDERLQGILDGADVLVCPSYSEGMPTVILEAMARGLAIIATDVGAVSLMVGSDNGILMRRPSVQLIREALEQMVNLPDVELAVLKQTSLRKVQQFTWDRVAQATLEQIAARLKPTSENSVAVGRAL